MVLTAKRKEPLSRFKSIKYRHPSAEGEGCPHPTLPPGMTLHIDRAHPGPLQDSCVNRCRDFYSTAAILSQRQKGFLRFGGFGGGRIRDQGL